MIKTIIFTTILSASLLSAAAQKGSKQREEKSAPRFLEGIEIGVEEGAAPAIAKSTQKKSTSNSIITERITTPSKTTGAIEIESATALQLKYALLMNTEVETVSNTMLLGVIESWWGTRYQLGGNDRTGIDCSAFTHALYDTLFKINLPRTSREQFAALLSVAPQDMREGDLVFFSSGATVSHVGFYLQNNKFVHASTSEGVTISDLGDSYWSKRFVGIGRFDASFVPLTPAKP